MVTGRASSKAKAFSRHLYLVLRTFAGFGMTDLVSSVMNAMNVAELGMSHPREELPLSLAVGH